MYCPTSRASAVATSVAVRYKQSTASTWSTAHPLLRILPSEVTSGNPQTVVDAFAGAIFDLLPGTPYDVELTIKEPGLADTVLTSTHATRRLPAAAGAPNKTVSSASDLQSTLNGLVAGDVLQLAAGTYSVSNLSIGVAGTDVQPIYIRGASRTDVVLTAPDTVILLLQSCSNIVLENLTLRGSGSDSGTSSLSSGVIFSNQGAAQRNITIRNVNFEGVDKGVKAYTRTDGALVYECELTGNNTWDKAYIINPDSGAPNLSWNDDGICLPGLGNTAWNNTLRGFGDAFASYGSYDLAGPAGHQSVAVYFYRNLIEYTCDDACEGDYSTRNIGFYDNYVGNSGTLISLDPVWGGPFYCFRNVSVNAIRGPFKLTNQNSGFLIYNNTMVRTDGGNVAGWYVSNNGAQKGWAFRNNVLVHRGVNVTLRLECDADRVDFTHNSWFADSGFSWTNGGGSFDTLAAARTGLPSRGTLFGSQQRHSDDNILTSNPWVETVTLGADHTTRYTRMQPLVLASGSPAKGTGVAIAGITDGFSGTAPDRGAVISGRATPAYGVTDYSGAAVWTKSIPVGTWGVIPGNTVADVDPANNPAYNPLYPAVAPWRAEVVGGLDGLMRAWCGMCFDASTGRGFIPNGEGHRDGFSNASYRWDLNRAVPQWSVIRGPSIQAVYVDLLASTGVWDDGRPRSLHTYNMPVYVPGLGPVITNEITVSPSGGYGPGRLYHINETTGAHTFYAAHNRGGGGGEASCYDSTRNVVWATTAGSYQFEYWSPTTNTWTIKVPSTSAQGSYSMCYMPAHDCILVGNGEESDELSQWWAGGFRVLDCATGTIHAPIFSVAPARNSPFPAGLWPGKCQPSWDAARGCAYAWDNDAGSTAHILRLKPGANPRTDPWTVDTLPVSGSNAVTPTAAQARGTYGRAFYWAAQDVFIVINAVDQQGYFFRLS